MLVLGNVWAEPAAAVGALPVEQVAWGFPRAGGSFDPEGVLRGSLLPSAVFGTLDRPPGDQEQAARQVFCDAGIRSRERPGFRGWLWLHIVSDAGLHAQGLRLGSLSELLGSEAAAPNVARAAEDRA